MSYLIKVLDDNNNIIDCVPFIDNLTLQNEPEYVNANGRVGLTRCTSRRNKGQLVLCYFYEENQQDSYAVFISEKDAYSLCEQRNKLEVAAELRIKLSKEGVEVI